MSSFTDVIGGTVLGISNIVVNPPATAALVPVKKFSLYSSVESLICV